MHGLNIYIYKLRRTCTRNQWIARTKYGSMVCAVQSMNCANPYFAPNMKVRHTNSVRPRATGRNRLTESETNSCWLKPTRLGRKATGLGTQPRVGSGKDQQEVIIPVRSGHSHSPPIFPQANNPPKVMYSMSKRPHEAVGTKHGSALGKLSNEETQHSVNL